MRPLGAPESSALGALLRTPRYEIFPTDGIADLVVAHVPREVTITVTASPRRGMPATVLLAVRLAKLGYTAVPHLSARMIRDRHELGQIVEALETAGIHGIFVVAGDAREPAGEFPDALSLLSALPKDHGLADIGITGGGNGTHMVYLSGVTDHHVKDADMIEHIVKLVEAKAAELEAAAEQQPTLDAAE